MKFEVLKENDKKIVLHVKGTNTAMLNAIRRTILNDLPAFAIEEVTFFENNSAMFNEYLAHRLGLIPLTFDDEVSKEAKITFSLDSQGPTTVYSKDLKSTDEKIKVAKEHVPVVKLVEGQNLRLEAVAIQGIPLTHAKFQSAFCTFNAFPVLKSKNKKAQEDAANGKFKGIIDASGKILAPEKCEITNTPGDEAVWFEPKENEYTITVESFNGQKPKELLQRALDILEKKATDAEKKLK